MGRQPTAIILAKEAQEATEEARKEVRRRECALVRANDEYREANASYEVAAAEVLAKPIEDYPQSYWDLEARRECAFDQLVEAEDALEVARAERDAACEAEADAAYAAYVAETRRSRRRGGQYHASA